MTFTNHLGRKDKRFDIKGPAVVWIRALEVWIIKVINDATSFEEYIYS